MFEKYIILTPINDYNDNSIMKTYSKKQLKKKMVDIVYNDVMKDYDKKLHVNSIIYISNSTIKGCDIPIELSNCEYFYKTSKNRWWYQRIK